MSTARRKKVIFVVPYPENLVPAQRFRYEQYLPYLRNYFNVELLPFLSEKAHRILFKKGYFFSKVYRFKRALVKRFLHLFKVYNSDVVFISREASLVGPPFFEWISSKVLRAKIIYDFDDSIWLPNVSEANRRYSFLKSFTKTRKIIALSDVVIAGNKYLADYALRYNKSVVIIPTTINTDEYVKRPVEKNNDAVTIGWSGSITTIQHFELARLFLKKLKEQYGDLIKIKVIGDASYVNDELNIKGIGWSRENEIRELSEFDIGIMPLPDDEWAKGKCGLKGLQYMALEIPTVMSPVGVNCEIIKDGQNGFLAGTEEEWLLKLSQLIENKELRLKLGRAGRKTVVDKYSVESQKWKYIQIISSLV